MKFAILAADVYAGLPDFDCEALVDDPAQPFLAQPCKVDARDHRPPAGRDEFTEQRLRRLSPYRLDVLEAGRHHPLLLPRTHISHVDITQHHARAALLP